MDAVALTARRLQRNADWRVSLVELLESVRRLSDMTSHQP
jgi:hypothetical protein